MAEKKIRINTISTENHMQMFHRLARVVNMHGTPGPRKGRSSK
jgi:hypothetical protein